MSDKLSFSQQVKSFPNAFWVANLMEMLERLAYFGIRAVVGLYIVEAAARGGLELTHMQRGTIFTVWALIQCLLPMFTGAYSDRYGYKASLIVAFTINFFAYIFMGLAETYTSFFAACLLLATGTAIFKPPLHGTLAHTVTEKNSSVGWGFFYMLVNIGGFLGPFIAGAMRKMDWSYVFYASAAITLLNFIPTLFMLKDYSKEIRKEKADTKNPFQTFADGIMTLVRDGKFMVFLAIFSGFWLMFMQLFDTLPIYIDEWVDSSMIISALGLQKIADVHGNLPPEWMVNLDAGAIVIFMLLIGYFTGKFKPVVMMVVGMAISVVGIVGTGTFISGWVVLLAIFVFAVGEMACSPKFSEYIGLMAPPEKKAIYMGYSNIPFAIGWTLAGFLSGVFYANFSDKYDFGRQYLAHELNAKSVYVQYMEVINEMGNEETFAIGEVASETDTVLKTNPYIHMPEGKITRLWIEKEEVLKDREKDKEFVEQGRALIKEGKEEEGIALMKKETGLQKIAVMPVLCERLDKTPKQITKILWDKYHPWRMWIYFGLIGLVATIAMLFYHFWLEADTKKRKARI
ncbi:MFS transporter [bacterium]|nr:MFS transporter [FCB group bacterium]MBL7191838.1 MFS transporter [bacterium]